MSKNLRYYKNLIDESFIGNIVIKKEFTFFLKEKLYLKDSDVYIDDNERNLSPSEEDLILDFINKKQNNFPLDYILNSTKFYENEFYVDQRVLIPRPETEILVDYINNYEFIDKARILDIGTGSGCIGISIALSNPQLNVYGSDYSLNALKVAGINKEELNSDNFYLINADWLSCFRENFFDIIVSNPPYICEKDNHLKNLIHEPREALISSDSGLCDIKKIIRQATNILKKNGILIVEHGFNQSIEVRKIFEENNFSDISLLKDFQNHPRVTLGVF